MKGLMKVNKDDLTDVIEKAAWGVRIYQYRRIQDKLKKAKKLYEQYENEWFTRLCRSIFGYEVIKIDIKHVFEISEDGQQWVKCEVGPRDDSQWEKITWATNTSRERSVVMKFTVIFNQFNEAYISVDEQHSLARMAFVYENSSTEEREKVVDLLGGKL